MKKRIVCLLLALVMALALLSGCGDVPDSVIDTAADIITEVLADAGDSPSGSFAAVTVTSTQDGIDRNGKYDSPDEVALYISTYGCLPGNYITKNAAKELGWDSTRGNLWEVAPGMSIGGDRFGNYEGLLPEGEYRECDVNYSGGFRGSERLIYGEDGSIYYTADHYESFTQLY